MRTMSGVHVYAVVSVCQVYSHTVCYCSQVPADVIATTLVKHTYDSLTADGKPALLDRMLLAKLLTDSATAAAPSTRRRLLAGTVGVIPSEELAKLVDAAAEVRL